jgi:hypothetical protein
VVEGPSRASHGDKPQHTFQIIKHIARSNAECLEPGLCESRIAAEVTRRTIPHRMRLSIDLDHQPPPKTGEVGYIASARKLTSEAQALGSFSQMLPQYEFWQRQPAAELARAIDAFVRCADGPVPDTPPGPSTMLRMVPLPVPGRICSRRHRFCVLEQTANEKC